MKKLIILLGVVGVSMSSLLVRWSQAPSLTLVVYRMGFASVLLIPWVLLRQREELRHLTRRQLGLCLLSGAFLGFHFFAYFTSLNMTSIASSVVLVDTEVFWVALAMFLLTREKPGRLGAVGIVLAFCGSVAVALADGLSGSLSGDLVALAGAAFVSVYTVIGRLLRQELSTTVYTTLVYLSGSLTTMLAALITGVPLTGWGLRDVGIGLGLAVFCTLLGHSVFSWGLRYEKASYISTVKFLEPVFASLLGLFLLHEAPPMTTVLGGAVILLGVILCSLDGTSASEKPDNAPADSCQSGTGRV